jgi:hypothetical protein
VEVGCVQAILKVGLCECMEDSKRKCLEKKRHRRTARKRRDKISTGFARLFRVTLPEIEHRRNLL